MTPATASQTRAAVAFHALRAHLDIDIVLPVDEGWDEARRAWNLAVDQQPAAVAFPETADARRRRSSSTRREHGLRVAPQGTGHNASPIDSLAGTLLVKTERMRDVTIDPFARTARVGAGALWMDVTHAGCRARARGARRLLARRGRGRLHARRRPELDGPQARHGGEPRDGHRARDGGRPADPRRRRQRARPVLGAPRRRRQLRHRDRDRVLAVPGHRGVRRACSRSRSSAPPRCCTPGASGPRRCRTRSPRSAASCACRRSRTSRSSCAAASSP